MFHTETCLMLQFCFVLIDYMICIVFHETFRTVPDSLLAQKPMKWCDLFNVFEITQAVYWNSVEYAKFIVLLPEVSYLELGVVSFHYKKQLSLPTLCSKTMNEWISRKSEYDISIVWIFDDHGAQNDLQYYYIYWEGSKQSLNQMTFLLHSFFPSTCPMLVSFKALHTHICFCAGQKRTILFFYM